MAVKSIVSLVALLTLTVPTQAIIPGGTYNMESFNASADPDTPGPTGMCWTAVSNADGADVVMQPCQGLGSTSQSWLFSAGGPKGTGGVGTIKVFGDKCLDVADDVDTSGTRLQINGCSTGNTSQLWQLVTGNFSVENVRWLANSTMCVDLTDGSQANGTPLQILTCQSNDDNQKWFGTYAAPTPPPIVVAFRLLPALQNMTGRALVVQANTPFNNQSVVLNFEDLDNQGMRWFYNGTQMVSWDGTACLDVTDGVDADGTKLQVFFCSDGNAEQQWVFNSDFTIQWKDHDKCIDLTNGNLAAGNQLQISTCSSGGPNQQWKIQPIDE